MMRLLAIIAASAFVFLSNALAADKPLTAEQAERFVATLPAIESLTKEFKAEGTMEKLAIDAQPKAGEGFKPYTNAVTSLKASHPADYARLGAAVKPQGFSVADWAAAGDRVMTAYLALKMEKENPQAMAQMQAMDPSMLDMMPPEMKAQILKAQAMMETINNTSAEDKKAVRTVEGKLDAYMEKQTGHAGKH